MNNILEYKGYKGTIEYCDVDKIYHGKVVELPKTYINYHGHSIEELTKDFREAIDFYLLPECNNPPGEEIIFENYKTKKLPA